MNTITIIDPVSKTEYNVQIDVNSLLPSGHGHKQVAFKIWHPTHEFVEAKIIKVTSNDMPFFDEVDDLSYDERNNRIIEKFIEWNEDLQFNILEWIEKVNEENSEEEN